MLLALIICHLSVLVAANPFHKYPFVFLLDVGNEELEKTNSEQIRVSVPGGSVALRYPAIGDGNIISHVRVSGIDFGTDLKANIVDGGPGYKYVVLVFMGNPGAPFDAVVTVNTMINNGYNTQNIGSVVNNPVSAYQDEEEDANNSAEDLSDEGVSNDVQSDTHVQNNNAELMQSTSNMYSYANNEQIRDSDDDSDDSEISGSEMYSDEVSNEESPAIDEYDGVSEEKDIHVQYADSIDEENDESVQVKGIDDDDDDTNDGDGEEINTNDEDYSSDDAEQQVIVDSNLYSKYQALKDHLNFGGNVYSQEEYRKSNRPVYQEDPLDYEDPDGVRPGFEDDEFNNGGDKFRDSNNNNYIDSDDSYAVAY